MKRLAAFGVLVVTAQITVGAWSADLPEGWRQPTTKELSDPVRAKDADFLAKATADFNGDGVPDEARLLKSTQFSGEGLWVRLSSSNGTFTWLKLAEINWGDKYPNVDLAMGIEALPPGIYPYGCFDDAKDCNFGPEKDRPKLKLRDPSLMYYKPESAASLFFWSRRHNKFMRAWLSD